MNIRVIDATEEYLPRILEIERDAFSPPWTHGALLSEVYREDAYFALALEDGEAQGFVILRRIGDEGELFQIAVDKQARRRGIADMLMQAAIGCARESGLSAVFLEVRAGNAAAIALYEKHGFKSAGRRRNYYVQPVEDAVIMTLGL